ncbi:MAG: CoB--CoM heterodisulfide reductase iron-sulfur subunit B family protein [Ignavibacteriae bacterium]|jgi:heterodisulfide reductase subunit B|nr:CoB--CoM heterodisulfide reductase iron-sulfur subunit B family protein [Ignavibacteriota bacterium]
MENNLKAGYFPGCSQTGTAREYDLSLRSVAEKLGTELTDVDDWNCCGATSAHVTNHTLANALAMRNIVQAEKQGLTEMVAPCAACYNRLIVSQHETQIHPELKKEIEAILDSKIENPVQVMNIVELFTKIGADKVKQAVVKDLKELNAACYYGCLLLRPSDITHFDDAEQPTSMEELIKLTGAKPVEWNFKVECCGAAHSIARKDIVVDLSKKILDDAVAHGANVMVVACPMCHTNLDMRQKAIKKEYPEHKEIPVLYLTELIGLALGMDEKELGINLHTVKFELKKETA